MTVPLVLSGIMAVAVLLALGRGLWRLYPAWICYGLVATMQSGFMAWNQNDFERNAGVWCVFGPLFLLGQLDAVLELFRKLSELYRRFQRDRWRWLVIPSAIGFIAGLLWVYSGVSPDLDYYGGLFLAQTAIGSISTAVLILSWIATLPVRIPASLRKHLVILSIYIATNTFGFSGYLDSKKQLFIRDLLNYVPTLLWLLWAVMMSPDSEPDAKEESDLPESTLEQVARTLRKLR